MGYFGAHFAGVPLFIESVKLCLKNVCKDVFSITLMLTSLNVFFTRSSWGILGYFLFSFMVFFLYFLSTVWFLMKFCAYILNKTLMVFKLKDSMRVLPFACLGAILSLVFLREGGHFQYFSLFLDKSLVYFRKILQRCSWQSCSHTKNNIVCCFSFSRLF